MNVAVIPLLTANLVIAYRILTKCTFFYSADCLVLVCCLVLCFVSCCLQFNYWRYGFYFILLVASVVLFYIYVRMSSTVVSCFIETAFLRIEKVYWRREELVHLLKLILHEYRYKFTDAQSLHVIEISKNPEQLRANVLELHASIEAARPSSFIEFWSGFVQFIASPPGRDMVQSLYFLIFLIFKLSHAWIMYPTQTAQASTIFRLVERVDNLVEDEKNLDSRVEDMRRVLLKCFLELLEQLVDPSVSLKKLEMPSLRQLKYPFQFSLPEQLPTYVTPDLEELRKNRLKFFEKFENP